MTAPVSASAPAVAAVSVRRAVLLAPVAVSVRRSLAVSLRTRPMLMARMPSASTIPKIVATAVICAYDGMWLTVSMLAPAVAAVCVAFVIWVAFSPPGAWISQPAVVAVNLNTRMACSVITVFGAEVPDGRALISWIGGLARQLPGRQGLLPRGLLGVNHSCICCVVGRAGRTVRKSASGLTCADVIPNAFSSCGVAT